MRLRRLNEQFVEVSELDTLCCELLRQIVVHARSEDHPAVRDRLFSRPTNGREPAFEEDWHAYVEPDLRHLFRSTQEVVERDLQGFPEEMLDEHAALRIPVKHLEDWIHCLNQARLALSARYDFNESDMETPMPMHGDQRALALFQVHFYGFLQECFLRQLD